jgi:hypothetical protein
MATASEALKAMAYDAEQIGELKVADTFRTVAHGVTDTPGDDWTADEVLQVIRLYRALREQPPALDAEDTAAIATVRAHFDQLAQTDAERAYLNGVIDQAERTGNCPVLLNDLANGLLRERWTGYSFLVSEAALGDDGDEHKISTVRLTTVGDALYVQAGNAPDPSDLEAVIEDRANEHVQQVREIVRLQRRGLVILDTDEETFVLTEAEYAARV